MLSTTDPLDLAISPSEKRLELATTEIIMLSTTDPLDLAIPPNNIESKQPAPSSSTTNILNKVTVTPIERTPLKTSEEKDDDCQFKGLGKMVGKYTIEKFSKASDSLSNKGCSLSNGAKATLCAIPAGISCFLMCFCCPDKNQVPVPQCCGDYVCDCCKYQHYDGLMALPHAVMAVELQMCLPHRPLKEKEADDRCLCNSLCDICIGIICLCPAIGSSVLSALLAMPQESILPPSFRISSRSRGPNLQSMS